MHYNQKVDFHSHYLSKTYYEYLEAYEDEMPDCFPTPEWSAEEHLALMDKLGIAFAFLSVSSPNLSKADRLTAAQLVRKINQEGAELVKEHPERFGLFASLPLPYTEEALQEAQYAIETIHADGFGLSTNYAGVYLGDATYDPLMEYLDEIGAVIAVHPVKPAGLPKGINGELPIPAMEFMMDTTRTFMHMVMHNVFERYPKIKWIFPHGGAFISILSDRISGFTMQFKSSMAQEVPLDFKADMRHVYFDVAGFSLNKQIRDLLQDVSGDNLLYGSDAPYTPTVACLAQTGGLEEMDAMTPEEKENLFTGNAVTLVPRLAEILQRPVDHGTVCYEDRPLTRKETWNGRIRGFIAKVYNSIFA